MSKKTENPWAEMRIFRDTEGREVVQFEVTEGPERGKKIFKGQIVITVRTSPDPRSVQQIPITFDFPEGKGLDWIKKHFDEEAQKATKKWEEHQKKAAAEASKKIIEAKTLPPLLGRDGQPLA